MADFHETGTGWAVRRDTKHIAEARRIKKENKELKDQLQTLAERLAALEEKVES